jgi:hypothetical protein
MSDSFEPFAERRDAGGATALLRLEWLAVKRGHYGGENRPNGPFSNFLFGIVIS